MGQVTVGMVVLAVKAFQFFFRSFFHNGTHTQFYGVY